MKRNEKQQPILLVYDSGYMTNPFGRYLKEILKTEGLLALDAIELKELDANKLSSVSIVVLAETVLSKSHQDMLIQFIQDGGHMVAFRADKSFMSMLGFTIAGHLNEDYWRPGKEMSQNLGLDSNYLQFHGEASLYDLPDNKKAIILAYLGKESADKYPAVVSVKEGKGEAIFFAFDLTKSIAYMRQGNPEWINSEGDGYPKIRSTDMFVRLDGRKWNDPELSGIPQADISQRFLAELIYERVQIPMPRMWYLPDGCKAVVSVLADSDGADGEIISNELMAVTAYNGRMSTYMIDYSIENTTPLTVETWKKAGHEAAIHPAYRTEGDPLNPDCDKMRKTIGKIVKKFEQKFGYKPRTSRNHSATWVGWAEQVKIEREFGIRMNSIHSHRPVMGTTLWGAGPAGFSSGTGQPQKFVDQNGEIIDVYQEVVHMTDESLRTYISKGDGMIKSSPYDEADEWVRDKQNVVMKGLSAVEAFNEIRDMVVNSMEGNYSFLAYHWHPITLHRSHKARLWLIDYLLPYLKQMQIPMWSAEMVLDFVDARNTTKFCDIMWHDGILNFTVVPGAKRNDLVVIIPAQFGEQAVQRITTVKSKIKIDFWIDIVFGKSCAFFRVPESCSTSLQICYV